MANMIKVYSKESMNDWRQLLNELATEYKITNDSDYTGVEYIIEWNER